MAGIDIFILAAEPSADRLGADLISELKKLKPDLKIAAVAGSEMRQQKIYTFLPSEKIEAFGFLDILFSLPRIIKYFFKIRNFILKTNPRSALFIDFPGFNLKMEKALRKKGYTGKLIHYVSPTVWAWHKSRTKSMEKTLDLLLSIFPFEKDYFAASSLKVKYVGHPLYVKTETAKTFLEEPIIALFPGSRKKVIKRNLPLQLKAAEKIIESNPKLKCAVSISHKAFHPLIEKIIAKFPKENIFLVPGSQNYDLMTRSKLAIATSGTITLELMFHKVPTVVTYAIKPLDLFIARKVLKINLPFYCIVNILAGNKEIFFEHFGPNFNLEKVVASLNCLLKDENSKQCKEKCRKTSALFEDKKAGENGAKAILATIFPLT